MKIDSIAGYPAYHKSSGAISPKTAGSAEQAAKTDVVDFSGGQPASPDKGNVALRSSILREAAQPLSTGELAAIKSSIQNGTYHRSTDQLVNAILSDR